MKQNAKTPRVEAGASQESLFAAGGGTDASVARPLVLVTRGRTEFLAHCPECKDWHRHVHLGKVTGPCGTEYDLKPRRAKGAA
ncbi:hypothetical protein [Streptomyces wuyuanensis]|uniref:Uncharacterized protein n=1 Tax=Streptomyces wuyuanensis TaxID=1196353 RepID=A0A1H0EGY9_9ACTN|nr:hypothetical protein [Streptomyces wuyuanensis]SDN81539.1 hypothetical protein SAMN05444921_14415 [Streptomyces wuyuanensis]